MGQLRSAVRALASTGLGPGRLLDALDAYATRHDVGPMTTLSTPSSAWLAAAALRVRRAPAAAAPSPGEEPCFPWEGRSTPLDVAARRRAAPEAELTLEPGSTLLLYTDGLIERRTQSLDDGMDRLLRAARPTATRPWPTLVATLVRELRDPAHADDVCLLAARLS